MANDTDYSALSSTEKKKLRGAAQLLEPRVHIGKQGITNDVLLGIETAFKNDTLIKIRFNADRGEILRQIAKIENATATFCVCNVGKTAAFYRKKNTDEKRKI